MDYQKFANSTPYTIKLLADAPEVVDGKYGAQHNYSCTCNGKEVIVSQKIGSGLDLYLEGGKAGDVFLVEKRQDPANPKNFPFHVEKGERDATVQAPIAQHVSKPQEPDWDFIHLEERWHINKGLAVKGAVALAKKIEEVEPIYHSIFLMLRKDGALMIEALNECKTIDALSDLWKNEAALWVKIVGMDRMALIGQHKERLKNALAPPEATPGYDDSEPLPF